MKIRMMSSISGLDFSLSRGDETERFSEADAMRLIVSGAAVLVAGQAIETAIAQNTGAETAVITNTVVVTSPDAAKPDVDATKLETDAAKAVADAAKPDAGANKGKAG